MNQLCRQAISAAALAMLGSVSSSAWADSYTIDFKTFFNTATVANVSDTKTLNYSVAKLTISDLADGSGVQLTLKQNSHVFPTLTDSGSYIDALWIKAGSGTLASLSGQPWKPVRVTALRLPSRTWATPTHGTLTSPATASLKANLLS